MFPSPLQAALRSLAATLVALISWQQMEDAKALSFINRITWENLFSKSLPWLPVPRQFL